MKNIILLLFLIISKIVFSQEDIRGEFIPILENTNYSFLSQILKDKKIVLLGEQSHGDGATFEEKITLIKYLHENLGFNTIIFESGMYDNFKSYKDFISKKEKIDIYDNAIGGIWSDTQYFQELMLYVDQCFKNKDTLKILGFDCQESTIFNNNYLNELENTLKAHKIKLSKKTIENIEKAFVSKDFEAFLNNKNDAIALSKDFENITNMFNQIRNLSENDKLIKQTFASKIVDFNFQISILLGNDIPAQNPRDEQMAKNLIFLSELFPNEKMICWGASYHFAKNLENISFDLITAEYAQKFADIQKINDGFTDYKPEDGKNLLAGAKPMGQFLKDFFKEKIYSIAFSSYEGDFGLVGNNKPTPILTPPVNSIENKLSHSSKAFFEFDITDATPFYSSILGNIPFKNVWHNSFDALLFIKKSYPPKIRTYEKSDFITNKIISYKITGKISDSKDNSPISNAEITIKGSDVTILANKNSTFKLTLEKKLLVKTIIVSAPNYISDTISIGDLIRLNNFFLNIKLKKQKNEAILLSEVRVSNKYKLSAKDIVINARNFIEKNYYQNAFNQDFYFKTEFNKNEESSINTQAIIKTYQPSGMKGSESPDSNIYAEIKQLRNIKNKTGEYYYTDKYGLGILFNKDLILSKSNVLYRTNLYNLKNEGKISYNDNTVYKISFENNSPGSYSTGFGYPAPKKSAGYLLINVDDFAVLKYEHCVIRNSSETKDKRIFNATHKIVATYKKNANYYFIDNLIEIDKSVFTPNNTDDINQSVNKIYLTRTIKSLETSTNDIEVIKRPISKLVDSNPFTENIEFWKNNLLNLEMSKNEFNVCE